MKVCLLSAKRSIFSKETFNLTKESLQDVYSNLLKMSVRKVPLIIGGHFRICLNHISKFSFAAPWCLLTAQESNMLKAG